MSETTKCTRSVADKVTAAAGVAVDVTRTDETLAVVVLETVTTGTARGAAAAMASASPMATRLRTTSSVSPKSAVVTVYVASVPLTVTESAWSFTNVPNTVICWPLTTKRASVLTRLNVVPVVPG